jgi:type II secretory pathway component GspD/PulD (secretin)
MFSCLAHGTSAQQPPNQPSTVRINFRGETPLTALVEYVSQRLKIRFLYDESLAQKKINLQAPEEIPVESLMDLLQSTLRINNLVMVETENKGWFRIAATSNISQIALPSSADNDLAGMGAATPVTRVYTLQRADPSQIATQIAPFLTSPGASSFPVPANKTLIVTDVASNLIRIQRLIELLDVEQFASSIRFVPVRHVGIKELSERLQEILAARARTEGTSNVTATPGFSSPTTDNSQRNPASNIPGIEVAIEPRTNQLILVGKPVQIEYALELLKNLDIPLQTVSRLYQPQYLSPKQLDEILRPWAEATFPPSPFETRIEGASLVILTTEQFHQQIARILPQFDSRETSTKQSPIRFYKIKNVPVQDISETLNSLQGGFGVSPFQNGRSKANSQQRARGLNNVGDPQPNNPFANMTAQGQQPGQLPFNPYNGLANQQYLGQPNSFLGNQIQNGFDQSGFQSPSNPFAYPVSGFPSYALPATNINQRAIQSPLGSAQVTADLGSNTLIIIAEPEVQQAYQQLIDFLDKRRPQVMIEARIVIIDTTDDYTLGVEVSGGDRFGAKKLFAFSSYGLSTVNPTTGSLAINPGTGFNATLVDPSTADVVVRALAAHKRARVLSAPKILVDDNAEGMLESVNEIPYTSVNASQTVATTSFAGFAKAGTSITVTPTISQGKHVNLDYVVTLNSFTGTGSTGIPPPRQTNEIASRVTVPDGYTIIVGGLTQKNLSNSINGIPYLEKIPILRELSSLSSSSLRDNSLFVFLRPVILEEDKFRDLRQLSRHSANAAGDGHNFPASSPIFMAR